MDRREKLFAYAAAKYGTQPEYLWANDPSAVLRRADNRKWYAVFLYVRRSRLGLCGEDPVWVVNVKCDEALREPLLHYAGIYPAYHMSKRHWLTALLDGTTDEETLYKLLDMSYTITAPTTAKQKKR